MGQLVFNEFKRYSKLYESIKDWKRSAVDKHKDKYDYKLVTYTNRQDNVDVICPKHGTFSVRASDHISKLRVAGCPKCAIEFSANMAINTSSNIYKKILIEKNITLLSDIVTKKRVCKISFNKCGCVHNIKYGILRDYYDFKCPSCTGDKDIYNLPHTLYYIEILGRYKIGITINSEIVGSGKARYNHTKEMENIRVIKTWENLSREEAFRMESKIIKDYSYAKYNGDPLFSDGTGTKELFTHDILGLDYE